MKKLILAFLCGTIALNVVAQEKVYQIEEVSVINYGDGRLLFRQQNDDKTPLQGEHRIIDGYHSEYLIANFKDGMYDGLYRHFKRNVLAEESTYKNGNLDGYRKVIFRRRKNVATGIDVHRRKAERRYQILLAERKGGDGSCLQDGSTGWIRPSLRL